MVSDEKDICRGSEAGADYINVGELLKLSIAKWYYYLISVVICVVLAVIYISLSKPLYRSSASLLFNEDIGLRYDANSALSQLSEYRQDVPMNARDEMHFLHSPEVVEKAMRDLNGEYSEDNQDAIAQDVSRCMRNLTLALDNDKSGLVNISYKDDSPRQAYLMLCAIIAAYNDITVANRREAYESALESINQRLEKLEDDLSKGSLPPALQRSLEGLYSSLLLVREECEISLNLDLNAAYVVSAPSMSSSPVSPKRKQSLAVAIIIGLLIPLCIIYLREALKSKK